MGRARYHMSLPLYSFSCLLPLCGSLCSYLSRVAPISYNKGDELSVKVSKMTSMTTQIPLSYYSLPHCRPERIVDMPQNLLQALQGDYSQNSLYKFKMLESEHCNVVCRVKLDAKSAMELKEKIEEDYHVNI